MIDFHSHILPGIDDGADSVECALNMLEAMHNQGICTVVSTPHYYASRESISDFLLARSEAYDKLQQAIKLSDINYPDIILGAEVALTPDLPKMPDLEKLCIGDTNVILVELPYNGYHEWVSYAVYEIISRRNLVPVLAHFERFCVNKKTLQQYESLLSLEVNIQINTDSLLSWNSFKIIKQLVKMDKIDVLGSDAHNMNTRRCNFEKGVKKVEKKFGNEFVCKLNTNAKKLLELD